MRRRDRWIVAGAAALFLAYAWFMLRDRGPYYDTARYLRMAERHNGFIGMKAEEVVPLVTKNGYYMILEPHTAMNGGEQGLFCFPLTNSHSREECFVYAFALDEDHVILEWLERFDWGPEEFFRQLKYLRAHTPD